MNISCKLILLSVAIVAAGILSPAIKSIKRERRDKSILIVLIASLLPLSALAQTYYVDASNGNDSWTGTLAAPQGTSDGPWKTLDKVTNYVLQEGDRVLLKRGEVWRDHWADSTRIYNRLYIEESGTPTQPIVIDAYGEGPDPAISGGRLIPRGDTRWSDTDGDGIYRLTLGPTSEFYTSIPALVRGNSTGTDGYILLRRDDPSPLAMNGYRTIYELEPNGQYNNRILEYWPNPGEHPADYEFEVSVNGTPIVITGNDVEVNNITGILANRENRYAPNPQNIPIGDGVFRGEGSRVTFRNCTASFGASSGIVVLGAYSMIDSCSATNNHSTGLYILTKTAVNSIIQDSRSEHNGNLEFDTALDRGGIGVQANDVIIRRNVVNANGNVNTSPDPGDTAISLFDCHNVTVEQNFVMNSAGNAIAASNGINSYGHRILRNVVLNWNLQGIESNTGSTQNTSAIYLTATGAAGGRFSVHNNTLFSDQSAAYLFGIYLGMGTSSDFFTDTSVQNNIVYLRGNTNNATRGMRINRDNLINTEINYNNIYTGTDTQLYDYAGTSYIDKSAISQAQGYRIDGVWYGYERNSINNEVQFSTTDPATDTDFDLLAGQPVIDHGVDVRLTADYLGRPIPAGPAPDIGAFEYTAANLSIENTVSSANVLLGDMLTYQVFVLNQGPHRATDIRVDKSLPSAAILSSTSTQGNCSGSTILTCNLGALDAGAQAMITVEAQSLAVGLLTSTATVSGNEPDPQMEDNSATATTNIQGLLTITGSGTGTGTVNSDVAGIDCGADCSEAYDANTMVNLTASAANDSEFVTWGSCPSAAGNTCVVTMDANKAVTAEFREKAADLNITIVDTPDPVLANGTVIYTITVTNTGPSAATNVTASGTLPNCNWSSLASGASATCTRTSTAPAIVTISQTMSVDAGEPDPDSANNSATASTTVTPVTDLLISISDDPDPVQHTGTVNYSVTVTNHGPSSATGVTVTGLAGCTLSPANIASNGTATCTAAVTADTTGNLSQSVTVNGLEFDPDTSNNSATASTTVTPVTDLAITMTDGPDPVNTDSTLTYTVTVTNNGPSTATGVISSHTLLAGVSGTATIAQGSCNGSGPIGCDLGNLISGQSVVITIDTAPGAEELFDATAVTVLSVTARASSTITGNEADPNNSNNSVSTSTSVNLTCLGNPVTMRGTGGDDGTRIKQFTGSSSADVIHTLSGDDSINGKNGNDIICGGAGSDTCNGGSGADTTDGSCETWIE